MQGFSAVYACFEGRSAQIEYGFGEKWWLEVATWWVLSLLFFLLRRVPGLTPNRTVTPLGDRLALGLVDPATIGWCL
jgi:hypothetical protein